MQNLKNIWFNFTYNDVDNIESKELSAAVVCILGQKINNVPVEKKKVLIDQIYSRTIWFSYRKNFPKLINSNQTSDSGWGCMLRAGQMIFAQVLRVHLRVKSSNYQQKLLMAFVDDDSGESLRLDSKLSPYSIQSISVSALKIYNQVPGEWFSPEKIIVCLQHLHRIKPLSETQDLYIHIDQNLMLDALIAGARGLKLDCQHNVELITNKQPDQIIDKICVLCKREPAKSVAVFIPLMLGLDNLNQQYIQPLLDMLDISYCQGLISGSGDKGYYILGRIDSKLVYLDPHKVQEATSLQNMMANVRTFFTPGVRTLPIEQLNPSIVIAFYCKDEKAIIDLYNQIDLIQQKYLDNFPIFMRKSTPDEMIVPRDLTGMIIELDDQ